DVPTIQSQPIESTQGTHRTPSAPRTPNPNTIKGESSAQRKTTIIIATQRSLDDLEAQQNVEIVQEHIVDEEIEQLVEGTENVNVDEFMEDIFNDQEEPDTRIEPESDKESLEVKKSVDVLIIHDDE
ncbi:hypothetical protein Tco_0309970, partial [Tanacetum coccineum]